ncbi:MAG TPA: AIR synthase family protein [Dehalococcoidia bacterium]|jgi:hydrogenase maturation factor|nr:AIR synthase family protein [Dehalococcoidia bacterium]
MDAGKLPNDLLASLLTHVRPRDPRVIIGPGIGRDAAVIDAGGPNLLVAKTDPVTFASDLIGSYAVHVNANDIACTGATPAWFLATLLLPESAEASLAESIFDQLVAACAELGVELVGGHTEITIGLTRPIIAGAMLGEVAPERLVRPDGGRPGDALILTKGIAIEGTSVLVREAPERLRTLGVPEETIHAAGNYLSDPGISVVRDARIACDTVGVHAMHDPTEGGLATALYEMAQGSDVGILIDRHAITILPATAAICSATGLDPLGLLASGALLIAVGEDDSESLISALAGNGIPASCIGTLATPDAGVIMSDKSGRSPVPHFDTDEVARFLTQPHQAKEHRGRTEAEDH